MSSFTVPLDGYYQVQCDVLHCEPIEGEFELVANSDRKWWQFWKPEHVLRQKFRVYKKPTGLEIRYLKKGEVVVSNTLWRIQ
jgi:hypothetical protein